MDCGSYTEMFFILFHCPRGRSYLTGERCSKPQIARKSHVQEDYDISSVHSFSLKKLLKNKIKMPNGWRSGERLNR